MAKQLIFVYNTDSGIANALIDSAHRLIRPSTYPCKLCAVTYGGLGMQRRWKKFIKQLGLPAIFWHRDEFMNQRQFSDYKVALPAVIIRDDCRRRTLMSAKDFQEIADLDELIEVLRSKLRVKEE